MIPVSNRDSDGAESSAGTSQTRLGPHRVPRIECGKCGTEHHIDAATTEYQGRCSECFGFLRRPTDAEHSKFYEFMDWKARHTEGAT